MKFNVTYEIVTPESAEYGDAAERGYLLENVSLREAIAELCGEGGIEADCYPPMGARWVTAYRCNDSFDGSEESHSLHFPDSMTESSRQRVMRLLGVYGVRYAR